MPNRVTVSGQMVDASLAPVVGGKVVAELIGDDIFEGQRVVTDIISAVTDATGAWSMDLIVNGEGDMGSTTWTVTGYNQYVEQVFQSERLFIPVNLDVTIGQLEATSPVNRKAAIDAALSRQIVASSYAEYASLPAAQKKLNDFVYIVPGA